MHLSNAEPNVQQAVPMLDVADMDASLRFYVGGLGFAMTKKWIDTGRLRWCWLELGSAALMLQERRADATPAGPVGLGVRIYFQCRDALAIYREVSARGVQAGQPFVGNGMWVTSLEDPDGYKIEFESPTGAPEGSTYAG
jgi:lactoylglutathione lyase